ncbi:MAG: MarR family winged helix-turn-helix transcriptional regulator [Candidatus Eiseniibacteriota bacterium]
MTRVKRQGGKIRKSGARGAVPTAEQEPSWRHDNLGRLLISVFSYVEQQLERRVRERGFPEIRVVHLRLLRELDIAGTRAIDLAQRLSVSKQAIAELVVECETLGLVVRRPDPSDGRAKLVGFSKRGHDLLKAGQDVIDDIQHKFEAEIGAKRMSVVIESMRRLRDYTRREAEAA